MSQGYINNILRNALVPIVVIFGSYHYATNKVTQQVNEHREETMKQWRIIDELAEEQNKQLSITYRENLKP